MEVIVTKAWSGKEFTLQGDVWTRVGQLIEAIQIIEGFPAEKQRLIMGETVLEPHRYLSHYSNKHPTRLQLVVSTVAWEAAGNDQRYDGIDSHLCDALEARFEQLLNEESEEELAQEADEVVIVD